MPGILPSWHNSHAYLKKSLNFLPIIFIVTILTMFLGKIERKLLAKLVMLRVFGKPSYKIPGKSGCYRSG